jgi:hypothetical protein
MTNTGLIFEPDAGIVPVHPDALIVFKETGNYPQVNRGGSEGDFDQTFIVHGSLLIQVDEEPNADQQDGHWPGHE